MMRTASGSTVRRMLRIVAVDPVARAVAGFAREVGGADGAVDVVATGAGGGGGSVAVGGTAAAAGAGPASAAGTCFASLLAG